MAELRSKTFKINPGRTRSYLWNYTRHTCYNAGVAHAVIQGIYKIENRINGHFYVGSSNSIRRRWYEHRKLLLKGTHSNPILQAAWNKYGVTSFHLSILEVVDNADNLLGREAHFIEMLRPQYNINQVVDGKIVHKHTPEAKEKIRQAKLGKKHSEQTRQMMSVSAKARGISDQVRTRQRAAVTGRPRPPEVRAKIAASHIGLRPSPETRAKISRSLTNRNRVAVTVPVEPEAFPASSNSASHQEPKID